jgi:sec-independent protein translocase protein TatB
LADTTRRVDAHRFSIPLPAPIEGHPQGLDLTQAVQPSKYNYFYAPIDHRIPVLKTPVPEESIMFGIGMPEMILILAIALIVIGPKKLPDLAKSLGRAMREFKRATTELKDSMHLNGELDEVKDSINEIKSDLKNGMDFTPDSTSDVETATDAKTEARPQNPNEKIEALEHAYDKWKDTPSDGGAAPETSDTAQTDHPDGAVEADDHPKP